MPALFAFVLLYIKFIVIEGQGDIGVNLPPRMGRVIDQLFTVEGFLNFGRGSTTLLTILFSAVVGAGMLARDRRAGALEIYFTRGIRPWHYVTGKWAAVTFLLLCQVLFPFIFVWVFGISVASAESGFVERTAAVLAELVQQGHGPVLVTRAPLRPYLAEAVTGAVPGSAVLSYQEAAAADDIKVTGQVAFEGAAA